MFNSRKRIQLEIATQENTKLDNKIREIEAKTDQIMILSKLLDQVNLLKDTVLIELTKEKLKQSLNNL